jgi:hypothetical protein
MAPDPGQAGKGAPRVNYRLPARVSQAPARHDMAETAAHGKVEGSKVGAPPQTPPGGFAPWTPTKGQPLGSIHLRG